MAGAKVLSVVQLLAKKYQYLENLPAEILKSFGTLTKNFIMIIWGHSGNGKTNLIIQLIKALVPHGKVLYVSLEEGHEASMQLTVLRHLSEEYSGKIAFADDSMHFDELVERLGKRRSEQFIIIDSVQYWDIDYTKYKTLKAKFKNKTFIFISHAAGKLPDGKTADKIRYDATIKVHVDMYVAFVKSRLGGNTPYVIWEEGAKKAWGENYKKAISGIVEKRNGTKPKPAKKTKAVSEPKQSEETATKNETVQ